MMPANLNREDIMASAQPTRPTLQPHHGYRSWTSTWYDAGGARRMKRFGREGEVTKKHALARYHNWLTDWQTKENVRNPAGEVATFTVDHLCDAYEDYAKARYVKAGQQTSFYYQVRCALCRLRDAYGKLQACEVTGPQVAELRDAMIWLDVEGGEPRPLKRTTVNDRLAVIKRAFSWACAERGKVPAPAAWAISQVASLEPGRSAATEPARVLPIADEIVEATIAHALSVVADMVRVQRFSGMRPGEVCIMRGCDIEAGGDVWIYRPHRHKTEHHGKAREVCLGPKAQDVIRRRLKADTTAYLFAPTDSVAEWEAKSGQRQRWGVAGKVYGVRSYRQAIHRACCRAFDPDRKLREAGDESFIWNPNQVRHRWATEIRKTFGLEQAAIGLGHSDLRTAEIYAERDREKAMEVARKVG